jgi:hypothetical protein
MRDCIETFRSHLPRLNAYSPLRLEVKMTRQFFTHRIALLCALASAPLVFAGPLALPVSGATLSNVKVEHVLLISVDGLHQQDLTTCLTAATCPHIAQLASTGVNYTGAFTPGLSDSVPGLAALVTGGSPKSTGLFYDDIYDRTLYSGTDIACTGTQGVEVFLQELVGIDAINGGALVHLDGGGGFNPQQLPRRKLANGQCIPVFPHDFIQTNTIFEVVRQNIPGAFTAWADKHAWGTDWVNGPSGSGVIDLARTEINSLVPGQTFDYTHSIFTAQTFDNFHVQILLNQIDGKDSTNIVDPSQTPNQIPVPMLFGTNFQTLSVAQKALNNDGGGYTDANFTPNTQVAQAITYVDGAIGKITAALDAKKLTKSTLIIITAKHGQTPVDYSTLKKIGHTEATALDNFIGTGSDPITGNNLGTGQITDDDVAFIWLNSQGEVDHAVATLNSNKGCPPVDPITKIITVANSTLICADTGGSVVKLASVPNKFGDPAKGRTPDIMIQPNPGVIYSKSATKDAEHGGFAPDDSNVGLLVSHPQLKQQTITTNVVTTQVAPTIINALGLNPLLLNSVKVEGTKVLPNLF